MSSEPGIEHRHERVHIETSRHRIEGLLTLAKEGYRSRISDVLNASERDFLTLTQATVEALDGDSPTRQYDFLVVARRHIVLAVAASGAALARWGLRPKAENSWQREYFVS